MSGLLWDIFEGVAMARGKAPALIHGDQKISFEQLHGLALQTAATAARHNLAPGDRCLIYAGNSIRAAAAVLATWRLNAVVTLVSDEAPRTHLEHAQHTCAPRLAFIDGRLAQNTDTALYCPVIVLEEKTRPIASLNSTDRFGDGLGGTPASISFTSGSTGRPKGVTQSHATLLTASRTVAHHLGLTPQDSIFCPMPWAFSYGYGQLLSTLLLGVTQVLSEGAGADHFCAAIQTHRPTVMTSLPSIYGQLVQGMSPLHRTDLSSLRLILNAGGSIPAGVFKEIRQAFAHCAISLNYGMTETYRTAGLSPALADELPTSVGFGYPGVSVAIIGEDGREAASGEVGEIVHRGVGAFMGYWGDPEATAKVLRPDPFWSHRSLAAPKAVFTGDLGWKDDQGRLFVQGRHDRMIKSMEYRVSLDEVEVILRGS